MKNTFVYYAMVGVLTLTLSFCNVLFASNNQPKKKVSVFPCVFSHSTTLLEADSITVNFTIDNEQVQKAKHVLWDFGDGKQSSEMNPSHKFARGKNYEVSLTWNVINTVTETVKLSNVKVRFEDLGETIICNQDIPLKDSLGALYYNFRTWPYYYHIAFPDVCRMKDGRLICVWRRGMQHMQPGMGRLELAIGSPDGTKWGKSWIFAAEDSLDLRDPSIFMCPNGDLLCNYFISYDGHTWVQRSTDNGQTWSERFAINSLEGSAYTSSRPAVINNEVWLATYGTAGSDNENSLISILKSKDNGQTWTQEVPFSKLNPETYKFQEPALVQSGNRVICHVRVDEGGMHDYVRGIGEMRQIVSDDCGKTWSDWREDFDFCGQAHELYKTESGVLISAFRWLSPDIKSTYVGMMYSTDNGDTWSKDRIIRISPSDSECGYPSIVSLGDDKFLVTYYKYMRAGRLLHKMQIASRIYQVHVTCE